LPTGSVDIAGCVDATQIREVVHQWRTNQNVSWKLPLLQAVMAGPFTGKESTPYGAGTVHDYMHAKVTVCDDTVFVGSFNFVAKWGEERRERLGIRRRSSGGSACGLQSMRCEQGTDR